MKEKRIIIIGAGPCGLGAAWRLFELGHKNFTVYEQHPYVGGLATSFIDPGGFTWDVGVHVIHSHYQYFDDVFEKVMHGDYYTHVRQSWVWIHDRFVPYPFQLNIRYLPKSVLADCLNGLERIPKNIQPGNFLEWISASFGTGIAKHFMVPFNEKIWAYPLEKMNYAWIGDRVATVDVARVKRNIRERRDDISWGPNHIFKFPKKGGTGEIWRRVAHPLHTHIRLNTSVVDVDARRHTISFSDGNTEPYDVLFSTVPLDLFSKMIQGIPLPGVDKALHASSVTIVGLGIQGRAPEHIAEKCWIYYPQADVPFYRATVFSHYSPQNVPSGTWSLLLEVSSSRHRPIDKRKVVDAVIRGARKVTLLRKTDTLVSRWIHSVPHGYPTPTLERDRYVDRILDYLKAHRIISRGRFGTWKYEISNQDHTFMQGVEWVNKILLGEEEKTLIVHH